MARSIDWIHLETLSPLIAAMPDGLRRAARMIDCQRGAHVFHRGDSPSAMYFLAVGEVHLLRRSPQGREIVLQRARNGFMAEASLDQTSYHCDAKAVEDSSLLQLPKRPFIDALAHQAFRLRWIGHLSRELRHVRAQAERLALKTARERIVHYLETESSNGSVILVQTKKEWAAELGLTHEALYRALRRMETDREIERDGLELRLRSA
jgi:CRP-like cAMP-binding protein